MSINEPWLTGPHSLPRVWIKFSPVKFCTALSANTFVNDAYPVREDFQFTMSEELSDDIAAFTLSLAFGSGTNRSSRIALRMAVLNAASALNFSCSPVLGNSSSRPKNFTCSTTASAPGLRRSDGTSNTSTSFQAR